MTLKCSTATAHACLKILNLDKNLISFYNFNGIFLYSEHIHHQHFLQSPETTRRATTATCDMIYRKHRRAIRLLYFIQHLPGYVSVTSKKEERRDTWSKSDKSVIQTFIRLNHCPLLAHYLSPQTIIVHYNSPNHPK